MSRIKEINFDNNIKSAFGLLKISGENSLIELKHTKDKLPEFINEVILGGATSVHSSTDSNCALSVTTTGDAVIRQTYMKFSYVAGQGQGIKLTFTEFQPQTDVEKELGYYSTSTSSPYNTVYDGIYILSKDSNMYIKVVKSGTEIYSVQRSDWDDPLDGSVFMDNVDFSKGGLIIINFGWLGFGPIRFGIALNENTDPYIFHTIVNSNSLTSVYMSSPNKPVRFSIRSTGGAGTLKQTCSTVVSEGNGVRTGKLSSINTGITNLVCTTAGTAYASIGIRLKSTHTDVNTIIESLSTLGQTNDDYLVDLRFNPTVASTFTYSDLNANSSLQYAIGVSANTVTGGDMIYSNYANQTTPFNANFSNTRKLGSSIAGVSDTLVLSITPLTNGLNVLSSLNLLEQN